MDISGLKIVFWSGLLLVFYAYLGYGMLLWCWLKLSRRRRPKPEQTGETWPEVSFVVCAYNEEDVIREKIKNSLSVDYPPEKITFYFVTDGSTDATADIVRRYPFPAGCRWKHLHATVRSGKIAAFQRAMQEINSPVIISTDANTTVNPEAVKRLAAHFSDSKIGAVAGEKRVAMPVQSAASSAGEGIYWRYESMLKKMDAEFGSVLGAAGELFAFRLEAYEHVPSDTLVEDFYLTMRMAQKGWRVQYEPEAFAVESASASVSEEIKRKVRIAAGGLQAVVRLAALLNVFRYGKLSFQYISHRVLRWTLAPLLLPVILVTNVGLACNAEPWYKWLLAIQVIFYLFALLGWFLESRSVKVKAFFIPYYFCMMNWAMYAGFVRLVRGKQTVLWEKATRL
ncbi:MAG: glycosyltransferase [Saprospiraceae bacterium]|nr:glycosyltransferase [Saprospiraceae bacterium]